MKHALLGLAIVLALTGCGGGDAEDEAGAPRQPQAAATPSPSPSFEFDEAEVLPLLDERFGDCIASAGGDRTAGSLGEAGGRYSVQYPLGASGQVLDFTVARSNTGAIITIPQPATNDLLVAADPECGL